jgi:TPR repeat protein
MYYLGQGVPQDYAKAVEWYQRAGDQGNVQAEIDLAFMYSHGQGLQKDYTRAVDWYQRAADQGDSAGQDSIGFMYLHGQGVQQNYPKAVMWFRKAAEQGNAKGQYDLGFMLYHGFGIAEDRTEAKRWFRKAASQGNVDALRTLDIRKKGLSQWSKITLSVIALGSLLFLIDSMLPSRNLREWRQLATMLLGIFGMAFVGIDLYSASRTEYSIYANALYWGRWTLAGVSILIAVLWLRGRNEASRNGPRSNRPS